MAPVADPIPQPPGATEAPPAKLPRGRHGLPRDYVHRNQHERMLGAMAVAVADKGYGATTVADVLERAGVSRKTFYQHFSDKHACFLASYDAGVQVLQAEVFGAYREPDGPWRTRAERAIARLLEVLGSEPSFARMCMVEVLAAGPEAVARYGAVVRGFIPLLQAGNEGIRRRPPVSPLICRALVGGAQSLIYDEVLAGRAAELESLIPDVQRFLLAPFLGEDL